MSFSAKVSSDDKKANSEGLIRLEIISDRNQDDVFSRDPARGYQVNEPDADHSIYLPINAAQWTTYFVPLSALREDKHMTGSNTGQPINPAEVLAIQFNAHDNKASYVNAAYRKLTHDIIDSVLIRDIKVYK